MQSSINTIRHVPYVFDLPNSFVRAPNERTDCMILSLLKQNSEWEPLCVVTQNEAISCIKTFWSTYSAPIRAMVFVRLRFGSTVRDRHERVYFSDEIIIDCFVRVCVLTRLHKNHTSFNRGRRLEILRISNRSINTNKKGDRKIKTFRETEFIYNLHIQTQNTRNTAIYDFDCGGFMWTWFDTLKWFHFHLLATTTPTIPAIHLPMRFSEECAVDIQFSLPQIRFDFSFCCVFLFQIVFHSIANAYEHEAR